MVDTYSDKDAGSRSTSRFLSALNWWAVIPADATRQERGGYNALVIAMPLGVIYHTLFIFLFAYWGIPELAIANIFSVLLWLAGVVMLRRHKLNWAIFFPSFEVCLHTILVVYFVGWGLGNQYYLITLMVGVTIVHWGLRGRLVVALSTMTLFILLYYYALLSSPQVTIDPLQMNIANILITSSALLLVIAMMGYVDSVAKQLEVELEIEHEKSETLINNILPEAISARLKSNEGTIADQCDQASILFADVVDFTPLSATMTPTELVELLNDVFSDFDTLTEKYGLEKIKTIGDCYMVASGVPQPRADHAQVLTQMALEMQDRVANHEYNGHKLAFRIGINSGPVVAGVIGRQKFAYDLWGDAVNTASRMESHGSSGCIQITRATYDLIKDDFTCEPHGTVEVKGKGELDIWHVLQEKAPESANELA